MTDTDQRTNQISDLESGFDGEKEKSPNILVLRTGRREGQQRREGGEEEERREKQGGHDEEQITTSNCRTKRGGRLVLGKSKALIPNPAAELDEEEVDGSTRTWSISRQIEWGPESAAARCRRDVRVEEVCTEVKSRSESSSLRSDLTERKKMVTGSGRCGR